ncbi:bile acid:sodium symporter family protein [Nevskia ramosa]|uniref:bile acid:sodium symporter family protein n=1 Tax=Nevskia ramosa TaxID=64002 RepID=UPI003D1432CC
MLATISSTYLPIALAVIMLGLGLSLTTADFRRVLTQPRAVAVALVVQVLILPAIAFGLCLVFALPPELAVGLMVLAASPGGTSANLFSHLARGDVALNITLTAVNSVLAIISLPLIINLALVHFIGEGRSVPLQFSKVAQVVAIVIVPVLVGMLLRNRRPALAIRFETPVKLFSILFLILLVVLIMVSGWKTIAQHMASVGSAALLFNLMSLAIGYNLPRLLGLGRPQAIAIGMEIGVHNSALAIAIALSPLLLNQPAMAIPATLYSPIMMATAGLFAFWLTRGNRNGITHRDE